MQETHQPQTPIGTNLLKSHKIPADSMQTLAEDTATKPSPNGARQGDTSVAKKNTIRAFGEMLSYGWILNNLGFFLFLSLLAVFYIANGHMADNRIRRINDTAKKLKDLQYEHKTIKSDIMFRSRESEMIKAAEPLGLYQDSMPPFRIKAVMASND